MVTLHKLYIKAFPRLLGFFLGYVPKPKSQHEFPKLLLFLLFVFIDYHSKVFCEQRRRSALGASAEEPRRAWKKASCEQRCPSALGANAEKQRRVWKKAV